MIADGIGRRNRSILHGAKSDASTSGDRSLQRRHDGCRLSSSWRLFPVILVVRYDIQANAQFLRGPFDDLAFAPAAWHLDCDFTLSRGPFMKWILLFCLFGTSAYAETTSTAAIGKDVITTKRMGSTADYLVTQASCRDVTRAFAQAANDEASKRTRMMNIAFVTFAFGYAQGRSMSFSQALAQLLAKCEASPELPFAGFPD